MVKGLVKEAVKEMSVPKKIGMIAAGVVGVASTIIGGVLIGKSVRSSKDSDEDGVIDGDFVEVVVSDEE